MLPMAVTSPQEQIGGNKMLTRNEKISITKSLSNDELLRMLTKYSEYSDVLVCHDNDKADTYEIICNEIKNRMEHK